MKLTEYLTRSRVAVIAPEDKNSALGMTIALFENCSEITDFAAFQDGIWDRESILPTGIGLGVAVPHLRSPNIQHSSAALTVLKSPIPYGSMDGLPVQIILLIAMGEGTQNNYLQYLAKATSFFRKESFRAALIASPDADTLWATMQNATT